MQIQTQQKIFNFFHDGTIVSLSQEDKNIRLKIDIKYIAEAVNENFDHLFVELINCELFKLENLSTNKTYTDLEEIKKLEIEILSCIEETPKRIGIICQLDSSQTGKLHIQTEDIRILSQENKPILFEDLVKICKQYWAKN